MQIQISDNQKANILFDIGGNIYLNYNNKYYEFYADNSNSLLCENIDIHEMKQVNIPIGTLKLTNSLNSLKGKAYKEYIKELEQLEEEDIDMEEDEFNIIQKYYPEDLEYSELEKKEIIGDEETCEFLSNPEAKVLVPIYNIEDTIASYETLIYNKDISSGDLVFKSKMNSKFILYRLRIYESGEIAFRPISSSEQYYKLFLDDKNNINVKNLSKKEENKQKINIKNIIRLDN
jgi:hypothetical protein